MEIERLRDLADAIDPVLVREIGFGLGDYLELAVRLCDAQLAQQAPRWATPLASASSAPLALTEEELAPTMLKVDGLVAACADPGRARAALEWASRAPAAVRPGASLLPEFGSALCIASAAGLEPLPACLLLEACLMAGIELAELAARTDGAANESRRGQTSGRMGALFGADPQSALQGGEMPMMVAQLASDAVLAAGLASELEPSAFARQVTEISARLLSLAPGATVPLGAPSGSRLPAGAQICRLLISAGSAPESGFLPLAGTPPGVLVSSLDDLELMKLEADDPDDLEMFLLEVAKAVEAGMLVYSSIREAWSIWRHQGKAFHRAGVSGLAVFLPGQEMIGADWARAGERAGLLRALRRAGFLDPVVARQARLTLDDQIGRHSVDFMLADSREIWGVSLDEPAVAVGMLGPGKLTQDPRTVSNLCSGVLRLLMRPCGAVLVDLAGVPSDEALRVFLVDAHQGGSARPLTLEAATRRGWNLAVDAQALVDLASEDQPQFHNQLIEILADGAEAVRGLRGLPLDYSTRETWLNAAQAAGPHFGAEKRMSMQVAIDLPPPDVAHAALVVQVERDVGARLRARGVATGVVSGADAVRLIGTEVFPVFDQALLDACAPFSHEDLLLRALEQYERAACAWGYARAKAGLDQRQPWRGSEWATKTVQDANEAARLRRAIGTVIERAAAHPSAGSQPLLNLDWRRILTIADRGLGVGTASEAAHHGLAGLDLEVGDLHVLSLEDRMGEGRIDLDAFHRARAEDEHDEFAQDQVSDLLGAWRPRIDAALRADLAFGLDVLFGLLALLGGYPTSRQVPVARLSRAGIEAYAAAHGVAPVEEVRAALDHLVLDPLRLPDAYEPWDQFAQSVRMLSHPLVPLGPDLLVGPWSCAAAQDTWGGHIAQGRLPWPDADTPAGVKRVLREYLQARNELLEDEAYKVLQRGGFPALKRIKKPTLIGLSELRGEIDVLFADPRHREIIVLEAKDPQRFYSPGQIARAANRLLGRPGRPDEGDLAKLATKVAQVSAGVEAVAGALGLADGGPWGVRGVVVTRSPVPAAYARPEPPFPFVSLSGLYAFVSEAAGRGLGA